MFLRKLTFGLLSLVWAAGLQASPAEGTFTATKSCAAYKSFKQGHNPGDVHADPGRVYEVIEENKPGGPWVLVLIPEVSHSRRWIAKECGVAAITGGGSGGDGGDPGHGGGSSNACKIENTYDSYLLALSWQAGFCEHYSYSGVKQECDNLNAGAIRLTNLTIHGLWPNKNGCGTGYGYCTGTPMDLEDETVAQIAPWMPNFFYSDAFGTHEWDKHGTCQERDDDTYFLLIKRLAEKFDASALGRYLRENLGEDVEVAAMEAHLKAELGEDVTSKISLRCTGSGKRFVNEFWINLPKDIKENGSLSELVAGARNQRNFKGNCKKATIHIEDPGV